MSSPYISTHNKKHLFPHLVKILLITSTTLVASISTANASGIAQVSTSLNNASLLGQNANRVINL